MASENPIRVEAFDVIGHDLIAANDADSVVGITIATMNRALGELAEQFHPDAKSEAIRMTIILEVDVNWEKPSSPPTDRACAPCSCDKDDEPHCTCSDVHYPPGPTDG